MTNLKTTEKSEIKIPERPAHTRQSFENPGRLKFPEIPGYTIAVFAIDDPNLSNEVERAKRQGYVPVAAEEIGYDKHLINPQEKGSNVYIGLGQNVKGLVMKIPTVWLEEDMVSAVKRNNDNLRSIAKTPGKSEDSNLHMTEGKMHYVNR